MRYKLIQDSETHWYVIPADQEAQFEEWCTAMDEGTETQLNFSDCMVNGPKSITFENWQEV